MIKTELDYDKCMLNSNKEDNITSQKFNFDLNDKNIYSNTHNPNTQYTSTKPAKSIKKESNSGDHKTLVKCSINIIYGMYITLACIGAIMHNYESKKSSLDKKYDSFLLQHADFNNNGHVSLDEQLKFEEGFFNSKSVGKTYNKSTIPLDTLDTWINNYQK